MARFQYGQGQSDKARELLDEILRIRSAKLRPSHIDLARIHGDLANFHENEGHYDEAEKCYLAALEITQQALGAHHPATDDRRYDLGWYLLRRKKRIEDAEQEFRRAIQVIEGSCPADDPRLVDPLMALAWVFNRSRKPHQLSEGASSMQRALAIARKHWGQDHARVARVCENFADYLYNRKRYADAEPLYRGALENRLARFGPLHPEVADSQRDLAWNQEELAELPGARERTCARRT
jgi:tetratricopeptide (TPR) repeat protein